VNPAASLSVLVFAVYQLFLGNYSYTAFILGMFIVLQYLLSAMAVRMDNDDKKMILYSVFLVIGYKQLIDILQLKAVLEEFIGLKAKWTSAQRVKQ
jgi:asparagine N-glycosylation enzyme membrane subunit Stt3